MAAVVMDHQDTVEAAADHLVDLEDMVVVDLVDPEDTAAVDHLEDTVAVTAVEDGIPVAEDRAHLEDHHQHLARDYTIPMPGGRRHSW